MPWFMHLGMCTPGLKRAPSADVSSGDEFTTYKKPLTDSTYTSPLANRYTVYATAENRSSSFSDSDV